MDNRADVDDGGYDEGGKFHHIANEEMMFRERIDEVLNSNGKRKQAKFNGYDLRVAYDRFKNSGYKGHRLQTPQTDALMEFLLKESDGEDSIRLYDEILKTASDKTKSEVFQAMAMAEKEQILSKFIDLINEREPKIRAIVKEFEPENTFPDGKGERLMKLLISPADVRNIIGIHYTPVSPMPDWDMEAEFAKLASYREPAQSVKDIFDDTNNPES